MKRLTFALLLLASSACVDAQSFIQRYASALGGSLGSTMPGTGIQGPLSGLAVTFSDADWGSDENGLQTAGRTRSANGMNTPSPGLPGSGGLNAGLLADPPPAAGIGCYWQIAAAVDNTAGTTAVHVGGGYVQLVAVPSEWIKMSDPAIPALGSTITIPAGGYQTFIVEGAYTYSGPNPPVMLGGPKITLNPGEAALLKLDSWGICLPLLRGLNPGTDITVRNQIIE